MSRIGAAAVASLLLAACSTVPPAPPAADGRSAAGRLAIRVAGTGGEEPRSMSAAFDLSGSPEAGRLDLSTPLGSLVGRAFWSPQRVALVTPQGETPYPNLDALTRDVLGESLPVAALFDWLEGRPWPGAQSQPSADGSPGFRQLGWSVNLAQFGDARVSAVRERPPVVTVQIKLDR